MSDPILKEQYNIIEMNNFNDSNSHLHITVILDNPVLLKNNFSNLMRGGFEEFFAEFFDVRTSLDYPFETGGYSGVLILGESHVNWHSFPEDNLIKIDIYSCKDIENKVTSLLEGLTTILKPSDVIYKFTQGNQEYVRYQVR